MSIMAFALVAAIACGSDTDVALPATGGGDANPHVETGHDPTDIEPELSGSLGLPAPGAENTDEMIVMLDGALDPADGETRLNDDELYVEGEPRGGADPDGVIGELLSIDNDTPNESELPIIDLVKEVADGSGLVTSGLVNPDTCDNALPPPHESLELRTRSTTDVAKADNPAIITMCTAWYAGPRGQNFVSIALIAMNSNEAANTHYELLRSQFSDGGVAFDEQSSRNRDWLTAIVDQGGIGAMAIVRIGSNLASVHNGPTSDQPEWNVGWMLDLADRVVEQLQ